MYLSRAELDPTRRSTMIALTSPQKFHGAVENSFSGERRRRLWRLDSLNGKLYLLLLSEDQEHALFLANPQAAGAYREQFEAALRCSAPLFRQYHTPIEAMKENFSEGGDTYDTSRPGSGAFNHLADLPDH